jgi:hypothetical protein
VELVLGQDLSWKDPSGEAHRISPMTSFGKTIEEKHLEDFL